MLKKVIITTATIIGIGVIGVFTYRAGAKYGMMETAKIYGEGLSRSILTLDVGEESPEFYFDGSEMGFEYNGVTEAYYTITRTR